MKSIDAANPHCAAFFAVVDEIGSIGVSMSRAGMTAYSTIDAQTARRFARDLQIAADRMDAKINADASKELKPCVKTMAA